MNELVKEKIQIEIFGFVDKISEEMNTIIEKLKEMKMNIKIRKVEFIED